MNDALRWKVIIAFLFVILHTNGILGAMVYHSATGDREMVRVGYEEMKKRIAEAQAKINGILDAAEKEATESVEIINKLREDDRG